MVIERAWLRWVVTALAFTAAVSLNLFLQPLLQARAPLLPFFPALVVVGLACGGWAVLALLVAFVLAFLYFWVPPVGQFWPVKQLSDFVLAGLFLLAGGLVAMVSTWAGALMQRERLARRRLGRALAAGRMVSWDWDARSGAGSTAGGTLDVFGAPWRGMDDMLASVHPDDAAGARQACEAALQSGGQLAFSCRMVRQDSGAVLWTQTDAFVTTDKQGCAVRMAGVTVDVTDKQQALLASQAAEERLREEARRKDVFLATLAHELRNPMAPIRYAVALLRQPLAQPQHEKALDIIARQSAHMARLLDDLLDMSRITRDTIVLQRQVIDLRDVAGQALEAVGPLLRERQQAVTLSTPPQAVLVSGDATRLQQVLGNLLDNAAKYSAGPGQVVVEVSAGAGLACVTVSDTGLGIPPERQAQVFDMFSRLDGGGAAPAGLGIGLAVSRRLAELHGGSLAVASAGTGLGSRFKLCLPLAELGQQPAAVAVPSGRSEPFEGMAVLVVDDNHDGADSLAAVLRHSGFDAHVAYSGVEALACWERVRPRAVLLDIGLPDLSGIEVARQLRGRASPDELALVAITGWGQQADRDETAAAGFDAHLVKPVEYAELEALLHRLVQRRMAPS